MRFLADMGVSPRTVEWLRQQGYDAVHLIEEGLERLPDKDIIQKARAESRIILTIDLDFGYLMAISQAKLPSVIIFRLDNASREVVESKLSNVLNACSEELIGGVLISVSENAFRVRQLPVS